MAIPVEEAIAALSTFSLEDEQPDVQGLAVSLSIERCATNSPTEYADVSAYRLSLTEDTKAVNQLNTLIQEGKEMTSVFYTYRSCVKALPQLPDSMKHNQADLYLETYQVLDLEMSRLREIQRWQASAASKLAADMQRFSRPERLINGPTTTHFWSMLKLLDILVQLDHLKNAKASIPNDFSWYKRFKNHGEVPPDDYMVAASAMNLRVHPKVSGAQFQAHIQSGWWSLPANEGTSGSNLPSEHGRQNVRNPAFFVIDESSAAVFEVYSAS